jgi:hypothetical protein
MTEDQHPDSIEDGEKPVEKPKKACAHVHDHVVCAGRGAVFNIYRCRYCGDEEWL